MRRALLGSILLLIGCTNPMIAGGARSGSGPSALHEATRKAIAQAWESQIQGARSVGQLFVESASVRVDGSPEYRGRASIEATGWAGLVSPDFAQTRHRARDLRVLSNELAYELGSITGPFVAAGTGLAAGADRPEEVRFHYMARWIRDSDRRWRIETLVGGTVDSVRAR